MAAAGHHFLSSSPFGGYHMPGIRIAGWEREDVVVETVEIRTATGQPRSSGDIDAEVRAKAEFALAKGRGVIAHLLDVSKTGLTALTRAAAEEIHNLAPNRVLVLADCCQMRSPASRLRGLVESGFMIAATGSNSIPALRSRARGSSRTALSPGWVACICQKAWRRIRRSTTGRRRFEARSPDVSKVILTSDLASDGRRRFAKWIGSGLCLKRSH